MAGLRLGTYFCQAKLVEMTKRRFEEVLAEIQGREKLTRSAAGICRCWPAQGHAEELLRRRSPEALEATICVAFSLMGSEIGRHDTEHNSCAHSTLQCQEFRSTSPGDRRELYTRIVHKEQAVAPVEASAPSG